MCVCMQTCAGTRGPVVDDEYKHCEFHGKSYLILLCHHLSDDVLRQMCKRDLLLPEKVLFSFQRRDPILSFGPAFTKHHRANGVKRRVINSSSEYAIQLFIWWIVMVSLCMLGAAPKGHVVEGTEHPGNLCVCSLMRSTETPRSPCGSKPLQLKRVRSSSKCVGQKERF